MKNTYTDEVSTCPHCCKITQTERNTGLCGKCKKCKNVHIPSWALQAYYFDLPINVCVGELIEYEEYDASDEEELSCMRSQIVAEYLGFTK